MKNPKCYTLIAMNMIKSIRNLTNFEIGLWIGSVLVLCVSFPFTKDGGWLNLVASLVGVTALIFVAKGDVVGQLLTVIFSLLYAVVSYQFHYWGEMITYLGMTTPIAVFSVITWIKNPYSDREVKVNHLRKTAWTILFVLTCVVTWIFYYVLQVFHTPNMLFSTMSIATSFLASSLMMLRSPFYAVAYAMNDIVLIVLWVLASVSDISYLPMVLCFAIFFINDMYGFRNWRIMKERQET